MTINVCNVYFDSHFSNDLISLRKSV